MQPLSAHGVHQISFSEEDTEQWKDVEDDDVSEQPAWDYSDFRGRSSTSAGRQQPRESRNWTAAAAAPTTRGGDGSEN
jgi:hypothetical protein